MAACGLWHLGTILGHIHGPRVCYWCVLEPIPVTYISGGDLGTPPTTTQE